MNMQIPERSFVAKQRTLALRALLMGCCAGVCWALSTYLAKAAVPSVFFGTLSTALIALAVYLAMQKTPLDRSFTLSPSLRIPAPLVHRGFDSAQEPIQYWHRYKVPSEHIFLTARSRSITIHRSWFEDGNWKALLCSLPPNPPIHQGAKQEWPHASFIGLALVCVAAHWLGGQSDFYGPFQRLALGAHNDALLLKGDTFRLLSYALLHKSDLHLLLNMFCLFLGATALRRGYTELSMLTLIGATALASVIVGDAISRFDLVVGSSGVVFGVFGFLVAAQLAQDKRLHPINRVARHRFLYLLLTTELAASFVYHEYGGTLHVAGFLTGFAYYRTCEQQSTSKSTDPKLGSRNLTRHFQWGLTILAGLLLTQWLFHNYRYFNTPYAYTQQMLSANDPTLTAIATLALCDIAGATEKDVQSAKRRAEAHLKAQSYNSVAIARADYWLGNTSQALRRIRPISEEHSDDETVISLWLAIEHSALPDKVTPLPNGVLPAGRGTAYLVSEDKRYLARLNFSQEPTQVAKRFPALAHARWAVLASTEQLTEAALGHWRFSSVQYLTKASAPDS